MENHGFHSDAKNQYPSQPVGQPYPPPGYGQPQPGYTYPSCPPYNAAVQSNAPTSEHQQQQVVYVGGQPQGPTPVYITQAPPVVSMVGAIVLSCFVFWLCGMVLGGIAFILAVVGYSSAASGDTRGALQLRNASYGLSIAGIVIGVIIIAVVAGLAGTAASRATYCYYRNGYYVCS